MISPADAFLFVMSVDKEIAESLGEEPLSDGLVATQETRAPESVSPLRELEGTRLTKGMYAPFETFHRATVRNAFIHGWVNQPRGHYESFHPAEDAAVFTVDALGDIGYLVVTEKGEPAPVKRRATSAE